MGGRKKLSQKPGRQPKVGFRLRKGKESVMRMDCMRTLAQEVQYGQAEKPFSRVFELRYLGKGINNTITRGPT